MSLTKNLGVTSAFIFCGLLLSYGMASRKSLDDTLLITAEAEALTEVEGVEQGPEQVRDLLEAKLPGIKIHQIEKSPIAGFYQAFFDGEMIYVSMDAQYIFTGNMLELADGAPINHTQIAMAEQDAKKAPMRADTIAQIAESDMVVFKSKNEQHVITVFTDVDCAYCRKLHKEVPALNQQGVTVRYLAYPRAGIGSDAYKKLVTVWCADDKMAAMDDAKLRREFGNFGKMSCENPIEKHYKLTRKFNLSGTPALILSDGELIGGYMPADKLINHLNKKLTEKSLTSAGR